jgi:hypothetical protein
MPTARIDAGKLYYLEPTDDPALGNAEIVIDSDGRLWAVPVEELSRILPGWQNLSSLDLAELIAGMPGVD